jgi:hypothetical protein
MVFDPSSRADAQAAWNAAALEAMRQRDAAERRAEENGRRNQRLQELTQALRGLSADAWRGLDPARAAERVLPILESMVEE